MTITSTTRDEGWRPADFLGPDEWSYTLTASDVAELDTALDHVDARRPAHGCGRPRGLPAADPGPTAGRLGVRARSGSRLPAAAGPARRALRAGAVGSGLLGLGTHLGRPFPQNPEGDLLGEVIDTGEAATDPSVRKYRTNHHIAFHVDGADTVGLLCLRPALTGGLSRIASSLAIRQELLWRRPDFDVLFSEPMLLDLRDEQAPGEPPYLPLPMEYLSGAAGASSTTSTTSPRRNVSMTPLDTRVPRWN